MKKIIMLFALSGLLLTSKAQYVVSIPYHEGFENVQDTCYWHSYNLNGDDGDWFYADQNYGNFGYQNSYCYAYIYSYQNPGNDWLVSPGLHLNSGETYNISFKYAVFDSTKTEKLKVVIGDDSLPANFTSTLVDFDSLHSSTYKTFNYSFAPTATGNYYIKFYAYSNVNQGAILIDEFDISVSGSGISSIQGEADFSVYPNPASDVLHIVNSNGYSISLFDDSGKELYSFSGKNPNQEINVSTLNKGIYFLGLMKNGIYYSQKIIVK